MWPVSFSGALCNFSHTGSVSGRPEQGSAKAMACSIKKINHH